MPNDKKNSTTLRQPIKHLLFGLTLCLCHYISLGQQSKIDSLQKIYSNTIYDSIKVDILSKLSEYGNFEESEKFAKTQLDLSEKNIPISSGRTHILFIKSKANALNNLGMIYNAKGNIQKTLEYFGKSLKLSEEINDKKGIGLSLNNIGFIYKNQGEINMALDYFNKSLKIRKEIDDKDGIAESLNNIGIIYLEKGNIFNALVYITKGLKIRELYCSQEAIAISLNNMGIVHEKKGDVSNAIEFYNKSLKIREEIKDKMGAITSLNNIGKLYFRQNQIAEALKYATRSLEVSRELGYPVKIKISAELLRNIYRRQNKFKEALAMSDLFTIMSDSIKNEETQKAMLKQQAKYEYEKKGQAIKLVQDKKDAIAQGDAQKQKFIIYSVSIGLFLVFLFALFILRSYRNKQKANIIITQQKSEVEKQKYIIEEKNKDITDSITYAKRIQQAKLPKKEKIYSSLPNSFILFKPKDIVSGDFYFFHKNEKTVFIASADCTGHGVPGAFMSMIGSEKLDAAVAHSSDSSEILKHLNKGIKTSLRQSESDESTRDGMDIALCSIDTNSRVVKYAGANRPLWIIRNGQTEIEEIKATKIAIGGLTDDNQHFDTHEIKLGQGDTFYICTDGYADQFSGKDGKKLMTRKFKEILVSIQSKTMQEQEKHLDNFVENWKAGTEQVDDILVIGVRL